MSKLLILGQGEPQLKGGKLQEGDLQEALHDVTVVPLAEYDEEFLYRFRKYVFNKFAEIDRAVGVQDQFEHPLVVMGFDMDHIRSLKDFFHSREDIEHTTKYDSDMSLETMLQVAMKDATLLVDLLDKGARRYALAAHLAAPLKVRDEEGEVLTLPESTGLMTRGFIETDFYNEEEKFAAIFREVVRNFPDETNTQLTPEQQVEVLERFVLLGEWKSEYSYYEDTPWTILEDSYTTTMFKVGLPEDVIKPNQADKLDVRLHLDIMQRILGATQAAGRALFQAADGSENYESIVRDIVTDPEEEEDPAPRAVVLGEKFIMETDFWKTGQYVLESVLKNKNNQLVVTASKGNLEEIKRRIPYEEFTENVRFIVTDSVKQGVEEAGAIQVGEQAIESSHIVALVHPKDKGIAGLGVTTLSFDLKEIKDSTLIRDSSYFDILSMAFIIAKRGGETPTALVQCNVISAADSRITIQLKTLAETMQAIRKMQQSWEEAQKQDTIESYAAFQKAYPDNPYQSQIAEKTHELESEKAWWRAAAAKSLAALQDFIQNYPESRHVEAATNTIIDLEVDGVFSRPHSQLAPAEKISEASDNPKISTVTISNYTGSTMIFRCSGTGFQKREVEPHSQETIELLSGSYRVAISIKGAFKLFYAGEQDFTGGKYSYSFRSRSPFL